MSIMNKIMFLVGESGSGKSYLQESLLKNSPENYCRIISTTTRPPRDGEVNGVHYNFLKAEEFKELINSEALLQHVEFGNNYYGTEMSQYNQHQNTGIFVCTPDGVNDTIQGLENKGIKFEYDMIFFMTSDDLLNKHGVDSSRISRGNIRQQFLDMLIRKEFDKVNLRIITDKDIDDTLVYKVLSGKIHD